MGSDGGGNASSVWTTGVRLHEPSPQTDQDGNRRERSGREWWMGHVEAVDDMGKVAGRMYFDLYPNESVVCLDTVDTSEDGGDNGVDNRGQGAARAMLDELDARYSEPDWWLAADHGLHSPEGLALMRGRGRPGRRKVHTLHCALTRPVPCQCELPDRVEFAD